MRNEPVKVLTIGGSDSGGAAGIQADLKTWTALGVYGMSALTAVTAQNSTAVSAVHYLAPELLAAQITAVLSDYGAHAAKTGFLGQVALIETVARLWQSRTSIPLVVDPVLVNHRGEPLFEPAVTAAYTRALLPLAALATPNWREAALLAELPPAALQTAAGQETAVRRLHTYGAAAVLITGLPHGEQIADIWSDGRAIAMLAHPRIPTRNTHGSGDTLSAAVCAYLAQGAGLETAVRQAQVYTARALTAAAQWRLGAGHGPLSHFEPTL